MKHLLFSVMLVALAALMSSCTAPQRVTYLTIPDETSVFVEEDVDVNRLVAEYGEYDGVFLDIGYTIEHVGEMFAKSGSFFGIPLDEWGYYEIYRQKYVVLNPESQNFTTLVLDEKPDVLYMRVQRPGGGVEMYGVEDLVPDVDEEGKEVFKFAYPNISRGTIIEEAWEYGMNVGSKSAPPLQHDIPLQFHVPVKHIKVSYAYPEWWEIQVKRLSEGEVVDYRTIEDPEHRKLIMVYEERNVPALRPEPYSPSFREVARYLSFKVTFLMMRGSYMADPTDWETFANGASRALFEEKYEVGDDLPKLVDSLTDTLATINDKLPASLSWVRENIEVTGEEHYLGNSKKVLKERRGSVYDVCALTYQMIKACDLPADLVLVHSTEDGWFDLNYVSIREMYQPAVLVTADRKYCLFPHIQHCPYNYIPSSFQDQMALTLSDEFLSFLSVVPETKAAVNGIDERCEMVVAGDGSVSVVEERDYRGSSAFVMRTIFDAVEPAERREVADSLLSHWSGKATLNDYRIENLSDLTEPLTVVLEYSVNNLLTITPQEILFRTGGLLKPVKFYEGNLRVKDRQNPIDIAYNEHYDRAIVIHHPAEWSMSAVPEDIVVENDFGTAAIRCEADPGTLHITQEIELNRTQQPKERIRELAALIAESSPVNIPTLFFEVASRGGVSSEE